MADLGLLAGLAEGFNKGFDSYYKSRNQKMQEDMETQKMALQKLQSDMAVKQHQLTQFTAGVNDNPDGGFSYNPDKQAQIDLATKKAQNDLESYDPNSQRSQQTGMIAGKILQRASPGLNLDLSGMSAADVNSENGLIGKAISGGYGAQKAQNLAEFGQQRIDQRDRQQAGTVGRQLANDQILQQVARQQGGISKLKSTLSEGTVTPQRMNEAAQELGAILTGGRAAAQGTIHAQEFNTLAQQFANLQQRITGNPQDVNTPQIKKYLMDTADQMDRVTKQIARERLQTVGEPLRAAYDGNSHVGSTLDKAYSIYGVNSNGQGLVGQQSPGLLNQTGSAHPQDNQAVQWAKSNPQDPRAAAILKANGF